MESGVGEGQWTLLAAYGSLPAPGGGDDPHPAKKRRDRLQMVRAATPTHCEWPAVKSLTVFVVGRFSPAIFLFLISIIPSIWILELHHQENRSTDLAVSLIHVPPPCNGTCRPTPTTSNDSFVSAENCHFVSFFIAV